MIYNDQKGVWLGMFCPDCGTQCDSKFCPSCGRNLQGVEIEKPAEKVIPPLSEPYYYERNGKTVDLHKVMRNFRNGWRKSGAYNYVMTEFGISKEEAREILDPLYAAHADEEFTFWASLGASFSMTAELQQKEQMAEKQKRKELEESGVAYCPKCLSTSITGAKRGYSAGQAILTGSLLMGAVGANKTKCVCLKCGHKWKP